MQIQKNASQASSSKLKVIGLICVLVTTQAFLMPCAHAVEKPRSLSTDQRIRVVPFEKDNVVPVYASTFTTTQIMFGQDEVIENIQNGDMDAWTVNVQKGIPNMMFIKPTILGSNTNMTVVTNQHTYYFHVMSNTTPNVNPNRLTYAIQFSYPEQTRALMQANLRYNEQAKHSILNAQTNPASYNWDYSFHGARSIMPAHVFDDGRFTYFQLRPLEPVPAIFAVDNRSGQESVVNYRREGQYIVVQAIEPQFTLRVGNSQVANIFNNKLIENLNSQQGGA